MKSQSTYHKSFPNPVFSIIQFQTYDICLFAVKKCIISVKARHCVLISVQIWSAALFFAIFPFLQLGTVRQNQPDCSVDCITSEITWKFIKFLIERLYVASLFAVEWIKRSIFCCLLCCAEIITFPSSLVILSRDCNSS